MARDSWASSPATRATMLANRSRDTGPEMALRRALHRAGLRYRVNTRPLPGIRRTADIVFRKRRLAVFVDGCFWHGCPDHYRAPTSNSDYWAHKVERNMARDVEVDQLLAQAGWTSVRVWEHEPVEHAASLVMEALASAG